MPINAQDEFKTIIPTALFQTNNSTNPLNFSSINKLPNEIQNPFKLTTATNNIKQINQEVISKNKSLKLLKNLKEGELKNVLNRLNDFHNKERLIETNLIIDPQGSINSQEILKLINDQTQTPVKVENKLSSRENLVLVFLILESSLNKAKQIKSIEPNFKDNTILNKSNSSIELKQILIPKIHYTEGLSTVNSDGKQKISFCEIPGSILSSKECTPHNSDEIIKEIVSDKSRFSKLIKSMNRANGSWKNFFSESIDRIKNIVSLVQNNTETDEENESIRVNSENLLENFLQRISGDSETKSDLIAFFLATAGINVTRDSEGNWDLPSSEKLEEALHIPKLEIRKLENGSNRIYINNEPVDVKHAIEDIEDLIQAGVHELNGWRKFIRNPKGQLLTGTGLMGTITTGGLTLLSNGIINFSPVNIEVTSPDTTNQNQTILIPEEENNNSNSRVILNVPEGTEVEINYRQPQNQE
ncbi:MAG: hypothetical protein HRT47_02880 [Candidatus Caenarcaniphilales bacterium]|nr:hypothetical protein [Candidatus Caenarcaniphilales bacterium]